MSGVDDKTIVFLDVDGTLLPFRARPAETARMQASGGPDADEAHGNPLLERLDPADGPKLQALGCQLVWATTWMTDANDLIAPRLGLPRLPVVGFPDSDEPEHGLHWKTAHLIQWAAGRTFVWLDDEITDTDRRWAQIHCPGKALLHRVDPSVGLVDRDFLHIREWLAVL
jgi:Swiss Army Knife RNA repair-like protein